MVKKNTAFQAKETSL